VNGNGVRRNLQLRDNQEYRRLLTAHYPGIKVYGVALDSGQRIVYFAEFDDFVRQEPDGEILMEWSKWGETVVKISNADNAFWTARAAQEIQILNSLDTPYFPDFYQHEVLSFDPETEKPIHPKLLVTIEEKIEGNPLSEVLGHYKTESEIRGLLYKIVSAIRILWEHKQHYVHRDIKPENILIKPNGDLVIIDLGISREAGQPGVTVTSAEYGPCTPEFSSPEQARNEKKDINYKSDIFSIGALGYFIATGDYPFGKRGGDTYLEEVIDKVISFDPPPINQLRPDISTELSNVVSKMMAKKQYQRYRRVDTLLEQLIGGLK
jgi:serine/threonine protein kinase